MRKIVSKIAIFLEMIKWEHSVFALPFAYLGLVLAERGMPRPFLLVWVTIAMVSFRTMAMAANRLIDARIDGMNPRTQSRALPAGRLKAAFVWLAAGISLALFETSALKLSSLCFKLSWVPVILAWLYPFAKRFTWLSHFLLGIILGIAPYGAWLASRGEFSWVPGLLTFGVTMWVAGFDIIYALQDVDFDRKQHLHSIPSRFRPEFSLRLTVVLHGLTLGAWGLAGALAGLGVVYFVGIVMVGLFLVREHWLVRSFGLKKLGEAFFTMNAVVSLAIFLFACADLWLGKGSR